MTNRPLIFNLLIYSQFVSLILMGAIIFIDPFGVYANEFSEQFKILANDSGNIYDPEYGYFADILMILFLLLYIISTIGMLIRKKYSIYLFVVIWIVGILFSLFSLETVTYDDKYVSAIDDILLLIDGSILTMATVFSKEIGFTIEDRL